MTSNNYTRFGIHNKAERYSWAAYHIFVLLSSLIGDTLILYASFQKDAFKLNKFILTVIQHIAVSDLAYSIFSVFPGAVSLIADDWVLGSIMCYARVYLGYFIYPAGMSLIAVLATSKFLLLKYPFRYSNWTKKVAHQVCCLALIPSFAFPILFLILDKNDVEFDYRIYTCTYGYKAGTWKFTLRPIVCIIALLFPIVVIISSTIPTLKYLLKAKSSARRARGSVPWQGTLAVVLTAVINCVSTMPTLVYSLGVSFIQEDSSSLFSFHFFRVAKFLLMINIMCNLYIYTLTIKSFRRFLFTRINSVLQFSLQTQRNMEHITGEIDIESSFII